MVSAAAGDLEPKHRFCRWDAFPQQAISYIRQNQKLGRTRSSLAELASDTWRLPETRGVAEAVIDSWRDEGRISEHKEKYHLDGPWGEYAESGEDDHTIHSNIRSSAAGIEVRNEATGETLGSIPGIDGTRVTLGGRQHRIIRIGDEITVTPVSDDDTDASNDTPQYGGRRRRMSETFAAHVRQGCGMTPNQFVIAKAGSGLIAFHFGGELFESALGALFPSLFGKSAITGIALHVSRPFDKGELKSFGTAKLKRFLQIQGLRVLEDEGLGRFAEAVPAAGRDAMLNELNVEKRFTDWITLREISPVADIGDLPQLGAFFG